MTHKDALGYELNFTEGEWQQFDGDLVCREGDASKMICDIRGWGWLSKLGEEKAIQIQTANAQLISAAPDLYHTLAKLVSLHISEQEGLLSGKPTPKQWMEAVDEASQSLSKARGGK